MAFSGAMVRKAADQTGANYTGAGANIAWDTEVYDEGGWFDTGVSTTAFTVPSGVSKVRVGANVSTAAGSATDYFGLLVGKNLNATFDGACTQYAEAGATSGTRHTCSGPIACSPGDTFFVLLVAESDTSITITATQSNFWIEKVA